MAQEQSDFDQHHAVDFRGVLRNPNPFRASDALTGQSADSQPQPSYFQKADRMLDRN
jgi:hypothetical protein